MTKNIFLNRRNILIYCAASGLVSCAGPITQASGEQIDEEQLSGWTTGVSLPIAVQEIYPCAHQGRLHLAGGFIEMPISLGLPAKTNGELKRLCPRHGITRI